MNNTSFLSFLSCFISGINLLLLVGIYLRGFRMGIFDQGNGMVTCDLQEEEELLGEKYIESVSQSLSSIPNYPNDAPAGFIPQMASTNEGKNPYPTYWGGPSSNFVSSPNALKTGAPGYAQVPYGVTFSDKDREPKMTYDTLDLNPNRVIEDVNNQAAKVNGPLKINQEVVDKYIESLNTEPPQFGQFAVAGPVGNSINQTAGAVQMPYAPIFSPAQLLGLNNPASPQAASIGLQVSPGKPIDPNNPDGQYLNAGLYAPGSIKDPTPLSHQVQTQLDILMLEEEMLNELLKLSEWLLMPRQNERPNTLGAAAENDMWECINNVYCAVSWGRDREKAEIIRRYFRRLDTTYTRKDGTYYSVVTEGNLAKKVINDLIEAYPWDNLSVLDGYRKNNPKEPVKPKAKVEPKQKPNSLAEAVDELLEAVKKVKDAVR